MALCLLTPDAPIMPPDDPSLLPDGWVCGPPAGGGAASGHARVPTLSPATPGVELGAHAAAPRLSSDLADG